MPSFNFLPVKGNKTKHNTRKSYKKERYLKSLQAEIFYEYSLEEYLQVNSPWELKWGEFGKWCEEQKVQRNT